MSVSAYDEKLFDAACEDIIEKERAKNGIGTLQEKTMHAVLKRFYEPDHTHQEIRINGYVADIFRDNEIIEIQTGSFNAMRKKLDTFLEEYPVTIVYPIIHTKWLYWINENTGEISKERKSPKTGKPFDAFYELYKIKSYLTNSNLQICLTFVDAKEYRLLNGWSSDKKKGSTRYDRIPVRLVDEILLARKEDYLCLIPEGLPEVFTAKEFAKKAKIKLRYAQTGINILREIGVIKKKRHKGTCLPIQHYKIKAVTTQTQAVPMYCLNINITLILFLPVLHFFYGTIQKVLQKNLPLYIALYS